MMAGSLKGRPRRRGQAAEQRPLYIGKPYDLRGFYDYDLNHREVQAIIRERYGLELPAGEQVITPSELMDCGLLEVVSAN
jgi:hypothetical protein